MRFGRLFLRTVAKLAVRFRKPCCDEEFQAACITTEKDSEQLRSVAELSTVQEYTEVISCNRTGFAGGTACLQDLVI